ncbi:MAG TPA: glycosyltransferase [Methyloceanibacter sp.]|nr:glycosyltransferase [Methyloceanibacter sp.]
MTAELLIACLVLAVWVYLLAFHGGFWLMRERDDVDEPDPRRAWPSVTAVIPARDEAKLLSQSLGSLLAQDYPGRFSIVLVDDQSSDGTAAVARSLAAAAKFNVAVVPGQALPFGWTGKVWAMQQGIAYTEAGSDQPDYLLFTDADIAYASDAVRRLVARAKERDLVLTSIMAKLNCESLAERALIPAFVFFFQMLYPFHWVNRSAASTAAAAGGCMLVDRRALERAGGIVKVRNALIDDCALAALLKTQGPLWLGLSNRVWSLRAYPRFGDIRSMVARSAYAQLRYSPFLLIASILAMIFAYLAPPFFAVFGNFPANLLAFAVWALMALAYLPILQFYRISPLWAVALPVIAAAYAAFTLDSAYQHWRGRGGLWKGRSQALAAKR